jgi:pyruvate/2-oxoglutarate dehydrogenase complex dihydrolipoamide dehydrogenase (E3) component
MQLLCRSVCLAALIASANAFVAPGLQQRQNQPSKTMDLRNRRTSTARQIATTSNPVTSTVAFVDEISADNPLKVLIAGGGVGGLALAKALSKNPNMEVVVLERTDEFKRFGGPIQLASNALQVLKEMDEEVFDQIMDKFTFTGNKMNGSTSIYRLDDCEGECAGSNVF